MRSLEAAKLDVMLSNPPTCATAVTISLTLTSSSASTINLDVVLHGMVEMFKQVVEKMSKYDDITPLSFRTFFRTNIVKREPLKTERYDSVGIAQADNSQMCKHEKEIDVKLNYPY
ncbi:putative Diphthine--ammonia ligase protein [Naja naja]|nr:putative Diphthine--ammonia ligase protein [Naja naja]